MQVFSNMVIYLVVTRFMNDNLTALIEHLIVEFYEGISCIMQLATTTLHLATVLK